MRCTASRALRPAIPKALHLDLGALRTAIADMGDDRDRAPELQPWSANALPPEPEGADRGPPNRRPRADRDPADRRRAARHR